MRIVALLWILLTSAPAAAQEDVTLPYSWLRYCYETRDPGCIADTITPRDLALLNKEITEGLITVENPDYYDPWIPFPADRRGDCNTDAATKRAALLALGLDPRAMRFETGLAAGERHIVLVVTLEGRDFVLDRKSPDAIYPPTKRPYDWKPIAREGAGVLWTN